MRGIKTGLAIGLLLSVSGATAHATVPGDYDGDGRSDITVARNTSGFLNWFTRFATGVESAPVLFGLSTDAPYAGDFDGDGAFEQGVVRSEANGLLSWYFNLNSGAAVRQWGLTGDTPITASFDGDDKADLVVVRKEAGALNWFVLTDDGASFNNLWGLSSDTPLIGDLTGNGIDELIAVRAQDGGYTWYVRVANGGQLAVIQWGLAGDKLLAPYDMNGDGRDDLIVVRSVAGGLVAFIRFSGTAGGNAGTAAINFGLAGDTPFVGSFFDSATGDFGVYRPSKGAVSQHFVFDVNNMGSLFTASVGFGLEGDLLIQTLGSAAAAADGSGSVGLFAVCPAIVGFAPGVLWKPASQDSGGERQGRPLAYFTRNNPRLSCLRVFASDGSEVSRIGEYERGVRWYEGWGCGSRDSGGDIERAALALTGSVQTYLERGDGVCVGPFRATNRTGSR